MITINDRKEIQKRTQGLTASKKILSGVKSGSPLNSSIQGLSKLKNTSGDLENNDSDGRYSTIETQESIDKINASEVLKDIFSRDDSATEYYKNLIGGGGVKEEDQENIGYFEKVSKTGFIDNEKFDSINSFSEFNLSMFKVIRKLNKQSPRCIMNLIKTEEDERLEFEKCKYDIVYWLENHCIVPGGGAFVKIQLNDHLRTVARLFEASVFTTFVTSRQSSKTLIAMACNSWYFNFWDNTNLQLINLTVSDNNKNMQTAKLILKSQPLFLRTWKPELRGSEDIDNVASKQSEINSKLSGLVIDKQDPDSTGRGSTSALYYDEVAYLRSIDTAFASIAFCYNTYSKMARAQYVPAPFLLTSTPNSLMNPSGKFFHGIWTNAYEVSYDEIKDMLPFEIYDWFMSLGVQSAKVYQPWYCAFGRVSKPENIDKNNPNNLIKYYEDMNISHEELRQLDPVAANWLLETKQAVQFNVAKIKKDIYCLFLSANDSAIFDETTADELLRGKVYPLLQVSVPRVKDKLNFYEDISPLEHYLFVVDPAFEQRAA